MTQIIRGQAVSTAISGAGAGQGAASPTTAGQTPPGTPRAQGQGQVKLTLAQLGQLTQVSQRQTPHYRLSCEAILCVTCLLLSSPPPPPAEAAGGIRHRQAGRCRRYSAGSDCDGSGAGPDHRSAADHTSGGHRHPGTWPAAHAGGAAQWPDAALPFYPLGLGSHTSIKHRYSEEP